MSINFEYAPYCKTKNCTARLDHWVDIKKGYCVLCQENKKNKQNKSGLKKFTGCENK